MEADGWASLSDGNKGRGMESPERSKNRGDLHTVVRRAGAVAVEQLFGQAFQRATQEEDERG